jgi:hypothetical protein
MRGRKWLSAALLRMTAPVASRQLPGIVRRFQQQVPCSIGATRRNVDNSRAFDHIGRFSPSAVHRCAMLGMPGRGDVPATDDGMGERLMLNDDLDGQRGAWHHPQVRYDRHAIRRRQFALRRRERCKRTMIRLCCMSVAVMFAAMMNCAIAGALRIRRGRGLHRGDVMRRTTGGVSDGMALACGSAGCHRGFRPT